LLHVSYSSETWSLALREGHKLEIFENKASQIKTDTVTGEWRKYHSENFLNYKAQLVLLDMSNQGVTMSWTCRSDNKNRILEIKGGTLRQWSL
jgi:hypothetical protein